jgi:hypothetical protein
LENLGVDGYIIKMDTLNKLGVRALTVFKWLGAESSGKVL